MGAMAVLWSFLGGAEASASPSFALPMFITIKKIIILHLFLGVPAATVGGTGTPWHTRGYAPELYNIVQWFTISGQLLLSRVCKMALNITFIKEPGFSQPRCIILNIITL